MAAHPQNHKVIYAALAGNLLYYLLLTAAVHLVGIAPASLIVGVLPVTVTLMGRGDHGAVPLSRLGWPLAMVMAGIACINIDVFTHDAGNSLPLASRLIGVLCATCALACWTWYSVDNARYLKRNPHFNSGEYYGQQEPERGLTESLKLITLHALHRDNMQRLFHAKYGARWTNPDVDPSTTLENGFAIDHALEETARERSKTADANSLIRLVKAVQLFSVRDRIPQMKARFLFLPVSTDLLMDPAYVARGVKELEAAGLKVETHLIESDGGHLAGLGEIAKAADVIRRFLQT